MEPFLDKVLGRFSSRDAHRYKSYLKKYIDWCSTHGLVVNFDNSLKDRNVWGSVRRIHWFLQDIWRAKEIVSASEMKSMVNCFRLISEESLGEMGLDNWYMDNLTLLYEQSGNLNSAANAKTRFETVCVNIWNAVTPSLNEKYFKTCLDKVKWLLDFQLNYYLNASLEERRVWTLGDLEISDKDCVLVIRKQWAILVQDNPLYCPLFALAVYLHLRFYGVTKQYRGDGFPDLSENGNWHSFPIIRGKSLTKFPRMETMGNYYPAVFQYCQLPYKKRLYFQTRVDEPVFPSTEETVGDEESECFVQHVGRDFILGMNKYPIDSEWPAVDFSDDVLMMQLFPDIERYEKVANSQQIVAVMRLLRKVMFRGIPVLYNYFPSHDLFQHAMFQRPQFIAHLNAKDNINPMPVPLNLLVEGKNQLDSVYGSSMRSTSVGEEFAQNRHQEHHQLSTIKTENATDNSDLRKDTLQFVKDQTLSNFTILLQLLSRLFDKLETKRSSKQMIHSELETLHTTLKRKISSLDSIPTASTKETDENESVKRQKLAPSPNYGDDESDGEDDEDIDLEDLHSMVQQLVQRHVTQSTDYIIDKVRNEIRTEIRDIVKDEIVAHLSSASEAPQRKQSRRKSHIQDEMDTNSPQPDKDIIFMIDPNIDTIEAVVLEWFTPNPKYQDECIHSMNKKYGKTWRVASNQETLYKSRKIIVEFYIHLVNDLNIDRHKAVDHCEHMRGASMLSDFSLWLKKYKRTHNNKFPTITNNDQGQKYDST
ncbi:HCL321Cp [Eremothecium sinecaudum]|uniref:HCL321Cp n=1 Tax=Eremothecium sinecaudum TaxID=45286 RepID=A0A120K1W9_9SACH|nr:HCL321Cp [Eremothecium sinecaudum]AMD19830.1 HCL321Cp [Eremothecium sinecaudum]